jgi:hypothetical protein
MIARSYFLIEAPAFGPLHSVADLRPEPLHDAFLIERPDCLIMRPDYAVCLGAYSNRSRLCTTYLQRSKFNRSARENKEWPKTPYPMS